jgi:hypothetical protein
MKLLKFLSFPWFVSLIVLALLGGCGERPPPPRVTAACNPLPAPTPEVAAGELPQDTVHSLHVAGERLYLATGGSFGIMDISNPAQPVLAGTVRLAGGGPAPIQNFSVQGELAYFSWGGQDFTIDVSNPARPLQVTCASAVPWPAASAAFGDRYFISNSLMGGIRIEERPHGRGPVQVASFTVSTVPEIAWEQPRGQMLPLPSLTQVEPMYVRRYTFDERYLYLLNVIRIPGDYCCGRLTILDLRNPAEPRHISTTDLPAEYAPFGIKAAGSRLFITFYEPRGYNPKVIIYDISRKGRPAPLTTIPTFTMPAVHAGHAYFPADGALHIWDLEGEDGPVLIGRIHIPGVTDILLNQVENRMAFAGSIMYIAAGDRLAVLNNEQPGSPYLLANQLIVR